MLSIEAFVITDFLMNLLVLGVGARSLGHVCWKRVTAAAVVGTAYAAAAYLWLPGMRSFVFQTLCLLLMALILFARRRKGRIWLRGFLCIAGSCVFAGGVMTLLARRMNAGSPLMTAAGWLIVIVCAFAADGFRDDRHAENTVLLKISTRMGAVELDALIDTGNRLHEPLSGLPVVVVGRRWLKGLLDDSCLEQTGGRLRPGFRIVRYGALGGSGEMCCFRPESVCIWSERGWKDAPDVWVAIYPGDIPSGVEALAPPVF